MQQLTKDDKQQKLQYPAKNLEKKYRCSFALHVMKIMIHPVVEYLATRNLKN